MECIEPGPGPGEVYLTLRASGRQAWEWFLQTLTGRTLRLPGKSYETAPDHFCKCPRESEWIRWLPPDYVEILLIWVPIMSRRAAMPGREEAPALTHLVFLGMTYFAGQGCMSTSWNNRDHPM